MGGTLLGRLGYFLLSLWSYFVVCGQSICDMYRGYCRELYSSVRSHRAQFSRFRA